VRLIDVFLRHEKVFRINWPPLTGSHARDVGSVTTHMFTNR
jgi:hypothetical protein